MPMINEYLFFLTAVSLSLVFSYAALRDFKWAILFVAAKWILIVIILQFQWVSEITGDGLKYIRLIEFYIHNNISIIHAITSFEHVYALSGNTFHFGYPLIYSDILGAFNLQPGPTFIYVINITFGFLSASIFLYAAKSSIVFSASKASPIFLYLFLIFSPDVIFWQTMVAKESLILLLHSLFFIGLVYIFSRHVRKGVIILFFACVSLLIVRFYLIIILSAAYMATLFFKEKFNLNAVDIKNFILKFFIPIAILIFGLVMADNVLKYERAINLLNFSSLHELVYGFFRFFLTPNPLNIDPAHSRLFIPQVFYIASLPFLFYGLVKSIPMYKDTVFLYILFVFIICGFFYGIVDQLQGPRHRHQLAYYVSFFSVVGLSYFHKALMKIK